MSHLNISEEYFLAIDSIPNQAIQDVIVKLLSQGLPPIPVVPAQHYGGFVPKSGKPGKIPSYFLDGRLKLLSPNKDEIFNRLPSPQEIELWFGDDRIGIGSYGSSDGKKRWLDIDRKNFKSLQQCEDVVNVWLQNTNLGNSWIERTGGGGYRVLVTFDHPPNFTTFSFKEGGSHIGEIMKYNQFAVLAPSAHPDGGIYVHLNGDDAGKVYSPEFAQIYQYTRRKEEKTRTTNTSKPSATKAEPEHNRKPINPEPFEVPTDWLFWDALKQAEYIGNHPNCQWRFDDYDFWLKWGMALYNIGGDEGFTTWITLSQSSPKYNFKECVQKWSSFKPGSIGLGTLIHWAKEDGLIFPSGKGDRQAFRRSEGFKNWRKGNAYTPTPGKTVDQEKLDVSEFVSATEDQVFCVKSGLGTGKTHDSAKWRMKRNRGTRELYPINDLSLNNIERQIAATGKAHYHLRFDDDGRGLLSDPNSHIHNCFDSLRKYSPSHFEGTDIYLDEAVAGLAHIANGETLGSAQSSIIRKFNAGVKTCGSNFLMDGNLTDWVCDLVEKKSGKKVVKILNASKPPHRKATFITGTQVNEDGNEQVLKDDITAICSLMISRLKEGHKLWIGTDSKTFSKRLSDLLTEDKNLKEYGFRVLVINSENSKEDYIKEFKKNPQKWLEANHYDVVVFSPACAYGLDVQNPVINGKPWFTQQHYIYRGVIGTFPQTQQMRRLRDDNVPTFVFCPERSTLPRDGILGSCLVAQEYQKAMNKVLADAAQSCSDLLANPAVLHQKIGEALREVDPDWLEYSIKLKIIDNFEKENLKECLIYALEQANYEIEEVNIKACSDTKVMLDDAKERVNVIDASKVFHSPEIDEETYQALMKQAEKTDEERAKIEKYKLLKRLPGIKESGIWSVEFIKKQVVEENNKLIEGLELYTALANTEKAKKALGLSWISVFSTEDGEHSFKSSLSPHRQLSKSKFHQRVLALNELGIPALIDDLWAERTLTKDDDDLKEIVGNWKESYSHKLRIYPEKPQKKNGKVIEGSEIIPSIKKLLELIAFPIKKDKKKKIDGKVVGSYALDTEAVAEVERNIMLKCIEARATETTTEIDAKWEEKVAKLNSESEFTALVRENNGEALVTVLKERYGNRITGAMRGELPDDLRAKLRAASGVSIEQPQPKPETLVDKACEVLRTAKTPNDILTSGLAESVPRDTWEDIAFADSINPSDREHRQALVSAAFSNSEDDDIDTEILLLF